MGAARMGLRRAGRADRRPEVGHAIYAPAAFFPGAAGMPTAPPSPDAVLLSTVYVDPAAAAGAWAGSWCRAMARDLVQREIRRSRRSATPAGRPGGCVMPAEFLGRVGFKTQRAHLTTPRMRMDLRSASPGRTRSSWRWSGCGASCAPAAPAPKRDRRADPADSRRRGHARPGRLDARVRSMKSASSLRSAAFGLAPTMDFTTSPPW